MNCKRCGAPLTSQGYICSNCGMMMDSKQIKIQKEYLKNNNLIKTELVSAKYGGKKEIFKGREKIENKSYMILFLLGILFLLLFILLLVYFF